MCMRTNVCVQVCACFNVQSYVCKWKCECQCASVRVHISPEQHGHISCFCLHSCDRSSSGPSSPVQGPCSAAGELLINCTVCFWGKGVVGVGGGDMYCLMCVCLSIQAVCDEPLDEHYERLRLLERNVSTLVLLLVLCVQCVLC